ncbi:Crp/Fnr family transcriptional regulator [Chryseobacterium turcicum]|uniref:Crp/Fnr family transcriptional regulator n=1 Tax=Chryseobacterium turcicum TaxID=2898076 RepID=A0A9Q3V517_9FLAO|nr:Crp/Fnr family transcriptional regulator [Chryseobacterium turcicum]MCD1117214.1 Crp/Fnr family transcriptional regulator [Chryseobacterium turcicum]
MDLLKEKFPFLSDEDLESLAQISDVQTYGRREEIISIGKYSGDFMYTINGILRGYYIDDLGEERNVFLVNNNMFFGSPECILDDKASNYIFETVTNTSLIVFEYKKLEQLASENKNIFRFYTDAVKSILRFFVIRLNDFTCSSPQERFLKLQDSRPLLIKNAKTKLLANFLGLSPNSLSRIKARLFKKR